MNIEELMNSLRGKFLSWEVLGWKSDNHTINGKYVMGRKANEAEAFPEKYNKAKIDQWIIMEREDYGKAGLNFVWEIADVSKIRDWYFPVLIMVLKDQPEYYFTIEESFGWTNHVIEHPTLEEADAFAKDKWKELELNAFEYKSKNHSRVYSIISKSRNEDRESIIGIGWDSNKIIPTQE